MEKCIIMNIYKIVKIQEQPELKNRAANWFHEKWNIPYQAYLGSIDECIKDKKTVPQWYVVISEDKIIGGLGIIENDFHHRKDLTPNICALYVEQNYRCQGIAGKLLDYACEDMKKKGIGTLYLITNHTTFYERYGWKFLCMVQGESETDLTRMYIHREV